MKKLLRFVMFIGLFSVLTSGCSSSTTPKDLSDLREEGTMVVGLDDTFAPMGYTDQNGDIVGFDVDLAKEVANRLGVDVTFQPIDWSMKEMELNSGNIDLIWNGYSITEEREEKVNFTTPYLENNQVIVVMNDSAIQNKADLANKVVSLQKESSAYSAVMKDQAFVSTLKNQEVIQYNSNNEAFTDLEIGRSDAIVVDEVLARYYIKLKGASNYRILEDDFGSEEYGVGVRKTSVELLDAVNQTLNEMKNDGTYQAIYDEWFAN